MLIRCFLILPRNHEHAEEEWHHCWRCCLEGGREGSASYSEAEVDLSRGRLFDQGLAAKSQVKGQGKG